MSSHLRLIAALIVLVATLTIGARRVDPLPALGPFLDPASGVWALARSASMPREATAGIPGLAGEVRVVYDDRAVPHIFAATEADAYRALGYVVARDRLFQMYLQTVAAAGRLTEIAGARALPLDREMRSLGLPAAAEDFARREAGGPEFTAAAAAYAEGVNAFVDGMSPSALPLEFRLIGKRPERWTVLSSYLLLARMGYTLAYLDTETERYAAASRVGFSAADALFSSASPIQEPIQPTGRSAPRFDLRRIPPPGAPDSAARIFSSARDAFLPRNGNRQSIHASNNWAVAPRRSASGHALLAGDPHLDLTLPSIWYEAHIVVPGTLDVYGVTIPGAPFIVIGFNRDVTWSLTNASTDVLDFYVEEVDDPVAPRAHVVDGERRPLRERVEVYRDERGRIVATDTMRFSYRGPVRRVGGRWMSMRWTVLEAGTEPQAFVAAQRARSVSELHDAFGRAYKAPAQNVVAADRGGHIALRSTGRFPVRAADGRGDVIRDGRRSESDWRGDVPLAGYPQSFDPSQGFLASANQQPLDPATSSHWWGGSFDPWRALRINEILRGDSSITADDMRAYQTDPSSARARLFTERILAGARNVVSATPAAGGDKLSRAARLLSEWDGRYTRDDRRAVLFEETMAELANRTWDELLPDSGGRRVATPPTATLLQLMADSANGWWDDRRTPGRETRDEIVAAALTAALDRVVGRRGAPDGDAWRWENVRTANISHLLRLPSLSASGIPVQGGSGTLSPLSGSGGHGASWRMVVELGPEIRAWTTYPGGQSGNPASPRYRDRIEQWSRGELERARVPHSPDALSAEQTSAVLRLRPR